MGSAASDKDEIPRYSGAAKIAFSAMEDATFVMGIVDESDNQSGRRVLVEPDGTAIRQLRGRL